MIRRLIDRLTGSSLATLEQDRERDEDAAMVACGGLYGIVTAWFCVAVLGWPWFVAITSALLVALYSLWRAAR